MKELLKQSVVAVVILSLVVNPALANDRNIPELMKRSEKVSLAKQQGIVLDAGAGKTNTNFKNASNGTLVVDIATPSDKGVSHNRFESFNVDQNGVIMNNSAAPVLTQLGGWSDGNRNLAGGEANIILNEVTGASRSELLGYVEIAGKSAEFVLANPNGITCDGCGFINTPRVSLVTGVPTIGSDGHLGFDITGGDFLLQGRGLNATLNDRFDIISRAVTLNADIYAKELNIFTGLNHFNYDSSQLSALAENSTLPEIQFALDTSALGGMYANTIRMIGTEKGVGVNTQGLIQSVADLQLSADGNLTVKNAQANKTVSLLSGSGSVAIEGVVYGEKVDVTAQQNILNVGVLAAARDIGLAAQSLSQAGALYSGLSSDNKLTDEGNLSAHLVNGIANEGFVYVGGNLDIQTGVLENQGEIYFKNSGLLTEIEELNNSGVMQFGTAGNLTITLNKLLNTGGEIVALNADSTNLDVEGNFENVNGALYAKQDLTISAANLNNNQGVIGGGRVELDAGTLANIAGDIRGSGLRISTNSLDNAQGKIIAYDATSNLFDIQVQQDLNNQNGIIYSKAMQGILHADNLDNQSGYLLFDTGSTVNLDVKSSLKNQLGNIEGGALGLTLDTFDNTQGLLLAGQLNLDSALITNNQGRIQAGSINITGHDYVSNGGLLLAQGTGANSLVVNLQNNFENVDGAITRAWGSDSQITAKNIENTNASINVAGGSNRLTSDSVDNQGGAINSAGDLRAESAIFNNQQGTVNAGSIVLLAGTLNNSQGVVQGNNGNAAIESDEINNTSGIITAVRDLNLISTIIDNANGVINTQKRLDINTPEFKNHNGVVRAESMIMDVGVIENQGGQLVAGEMQVKSTSLDNTQGILAATDESAVQNSVEITNAVKNESGAIYAKGNNFDFAAGSILNQQGEINHSGDGQFLLSVGLLDNNTGAIHSEAYLVLSAESFDNNAGKVTSGGDADISVDGNIANNKGVISAANQQSITSESIDNNDGVVAANGLVLNTTELKNTAAGHIEASNLHINAVNFLNTGSILSTGDDALFNITTFTNQGLLEVYAEQLHLGDTSFSNKGGILVHHGLGDLTINSTTHLDNSYSVIATNGSLSLSADSLDNNSGKLIVGTNLQLAVNELDNQNGVISTNGAVSLQLANWNNTQGELLIGNGSNDASFTIAGSLNNQQGKVIYDGLGVLGIKADGINNSAEGFIGSTGNLTVNLIGSLDNSEGSLVAKNNLQVAATSVDNTEGFIEASAIDLASDAIVNSGTIRAFGEADNSLVIHSTLLNNQHGLIEAQANNISLVNSGLDNRSGIVSHLGTGQLLIEQDALQNDAGKILSKGAINLLVSELQNTNSAELVSLGLLNIEADNLINQNSVLQSGSGIKLSAGLLENSGDSHILGLGDQTSTLNVDTLNNQALLAVNGNLDIDAQSVHNSGVIQSYRTLNSTVDYFENAGVLEAQEWLFSTVSINNLLSGSVVVDRLQGEVESLINSGGIKISGVSDESSLIVGELANTGAIESNNHYLFVKADLLDNQDGELIFSDNSDVSIESSLISNQQGKISGGKLSVVGTALNNSQGAVTAADLKGQFESIKNAKGLLQTDQKLQLVVNQQLDNQEGNILSLGDLTTELTVQQLLNNLGSISSAKIDANLGEFNNQNGLMSGNSLDVRAVSLNNSQGRILTTTGPESEGLVVAVDELLNNEQGAIQGGGTNMEIGANQIHNNNGSLTHIGNGTFVINADDLFNTNNASIHAAHQLELDILNSLTNNGSSIYSENLLALTTQSLVNTDAIVFADQELSITADTLVNQSSGGDDKSIIKSDQLALTIGQLLENSENSRIEANLFGLDTAQATLNNAGVILSSSTTLDEFSIAALNLNNSGVIQSHAKSMRLDAGQLTNSGLVNHIGGDLLTVVADSLVNSDGRIEADKDFTLLVKQDIENTAGLLLAKQGNLALQAENLGNTGGVIVAKNASINVENTVSNVAGEISANSLQINASTLSNTQANALISASVLDLNLSDSLTNGNLALIDSDDLSASAKQINNQGAIQGNSVVLDGQYLDNSHGSLLALMTSGEALSLLFTKGISNQSGNIKSNGDSLIIKGAIDNELGNIALAGQGVLQVEAINNQSGNLISNGDIQIDAGVGAINNHNGIIQALADVNIIADTIDNTDGDIVAGKALGLQTTSINNSMGGLLLAEGTADSDFALSGAINNHQGTIEAHAHNLSFAGASINNQSGKVMHFGEGTLGLYGAGIFNNLDGDLVSQGNILIDMSGNQGAVNNQNGLISAKAIDISATQLVDNTNEGIIKGGSIILAADQIKNAHGHLYAVGSQTGSIQLISNNIINNNHGELLSDATDWALNLDQFDNTNGSIIHTGSGALTISNSGVMDNGGVISTKADLLLTLSGLNNSGQLVADGNILLNSDAAITNSTSGIIKAGGGLTLNANGQSLDNQGEINSSMVLDFNLANGTIANAGRIISNAIDAQLTANQFTNSGTFAHNGTGVVQISANQLNNQNVMQSATGAFSIVAAHLSNQGTLSGRSIQVSGLEVANNTGRIEAENLNLAGQQLENAGTLAATGAQNSLSLLLADISNTSTGVIATNSLNQEFHGNLVSAGKIIHAGVGNLDLGNNGSVDLAGGEIQTAGQARLTGNVIGSSDLFAQQGIIIATNSVFNNIGKTIYTPGDISIQSGFNNSSNGKLIADGKLTVSTTQAVNNNAGLMQGRDLSLTAGDFTNIGGTLTSLGGGNAQLSANSINNQNGKIQSTNNVLSLSAIGGNINNTNGEILHSGNSVDINAAQFDNSLGDLITLGSLVFDLSGNLVNAGGEISSSHFDIKAANINNSGNGLLEGTGTQQSQIQAVNFNNQNGSLIANSSNVNINLTGALDNRSGLINHAGATSLSVNAGSMLTDANSYLLSKGNLDLVSSAAINNAGEISARFNNTITANNLSNSGLIGSESGMVKLNLAGLTLTNLTSGRIASGNQLDVQANKIANTGILESQNLLSLTLDSFTSVGTIRANDTLIINLTDTLTVGQGESISAPGSLSITTAGGFDNSGLISAVSDLTLTGSFLNNWSTGEIKAGLGEGSVFKITGDVANHGLISSASDLTINSHNFENFAAGRLVAGQNLTMNMSGTNLINHNVIFAGNDLTVSNVNSIDNLSNAVIFAGGDMMLDATNQIRNIEARIESIGNMTLKAGNLIENKATVKTVKDGVTTSKDINVDSKSFNQTSPGGSTSWIELSGTQVDTTEWSYELVKESVIRSGGNMDLNGGASALIRNQHGSITAGGNMTLNAADLQSISDQSRISTTTRDFKQAIITSCVFPGSQCSGALGPKPRTYGAAETDENFTGPIYGNFYAGGSIIGSVANKIGLESGGYSKSNDSHNTETNPAAGANAPSVTQSGSAAVGNVAVNSSTENAENPDDVQRQKTGTENLLDTTASNGGGVNGSPITSVDWQLQGATSGTSTAVNNGQIANNIQELLQQLTQQSNALDADAIHQTEQGKWLEKLLAEFGNINVQVDAAGSQINLADSLLDVLADIDAGQNPFDDDASLQEFIAAIDETLSLDNSDLSAADELLTEKAQQLALLLAKAQLQQRSNMAFGPLNFNVLPLNFDVNNLSGLYVLAKSPDSRYLIETRPEFTDYQLFLGSDYLLEALGYDPDNTMQRLGDAFFENALIRDALMTQAGSRYLGHNTSDYEQMMYLMNNAVVANQQLQLTLGVELTPEQCAALTQDIMWLVKKRLNGHTVLVPHLYLVSVSEDKLVASQSAMAAGKNIDLRAGGDINVQTQMAAGNSLLLSTTGNLAQDGRLVTRGDVRLIAGQQISNTGSIESRMVGLQSQGTLNNQGSINAAERLVLNSLQDSVINSNTGRLVSAGDLSIVAEKNIHNQQGYIEGTDVSLVSKTGDIINRTEVTTTTSRDGRITRTEIGEASTIVSHNNLLMDAGNNLDLQGSQLKAANDIQLKAGNEIQLDALEIVERTDSSTRKRTRVESETRHQVVSIEAGHRLTLDAGRDVNAEGTRFTAGSDLGLTAGRDLNLSAVANTTHSENLAKRKKRIDTETTHTLVDLQSGGNVILKAGQDANLTGTHINAAGDVNLAAARDTNLTAVVDSDYHYDYTKKKRSLGRSKTKENETLDQTVVGGVINAGGNILVNAHGNSEGELVTDASGNVNLVGASLNAGNHVVVAADESVNITGKTYQELDFHRTKKSGLGGMSKKDKGTVEADTKLQNAQINAGGSAHLIAGDDLTLAATDVMVDGNINMEAVDHLLITAGEVVNNSERWSKKSGIGSGGNLYGSKEHKSGEGVTSTQASTLVAGGNVTGRAGSGEIVGSDMSGGQGVNITTDMGDIDVKAGRTSVESYSYDKEMSVGLGDMLEGLSRPDQLVKNQDGRATVKLADAKYDKVDTKTNYTEMRGSRIDSDGDVTLVATAGSVNVIGSDITADADQDGNGTLGLAGATGVNVKEATETYETQTKEIHGEAELSFVVQHQAAEVAKAVIAVDEAKDKLEQAKKDYKNYERNVDQLEEQLDQLEADYANKVPGVNYDDLLELRELVGDVKEDKEWYQAGIALAAVNLTSATTALIQQTAAAAQSTATWGFNAGLQLDIDASKTDSQLKTTTAVASNLSGNNIVIQTGTANGNGQLDTKGTQTTISGSHLNAKDRISIQTGDLNLLASKNTSESSTETEHGHITAQMTVYGASGGASVNGSYDRNKNSDRSTSHNNSTLTADNIDLQVSGDANIRGANVHANNHLQTDIAGNLNLESVQDRSNSRNTGAGVSGGVSFGGNGDVSGVNGGINNSNGMSVTRETVLTSLTSGGTADVNVQGHTQITGALLATINEDGGDRNQLNFNTGSLSTTDLRNIKQTTQTSAGISANLSVGEAKDINPREGQPTAEGANGKALYANTSNVTYANTNENGASKTLATLGHGNITVGGVQFEKDGELTEAGKANGSPLIAVNRDTQNTEKELWNSEQSQTVDATLDHRLLSSDGRKEIKEDFKRTEIGIDAIGNLAKNSVSLTGKGEGETSLRQHMMDSQDFFTATKVFASNPKNEEHIKAINSGTATPEEKDKAYTALANSIAQQMGVDPVQAMTLVQDHYNLNTRNYDGTTINQQIQGAYAQDPLNQHTGKKEGLIFLVDDNIANTTDAVKILGHETSHHIDANRNANAPDTETYHNNRENYADIMGMATADYVNFNFASNGYSALGATNARNGSTSNSATVIVNNARFNRLDPNAVEYRELAAKELTFIRDNAKAYAGQQNISEEQARKELTQQALLMVDSKWASQEHITENGNARNFLVDASKGNTFDIITPEGYEETAFFTATDKQYQDTYLLSAGAAFAEGAHLQVDKPLLDTSGSMIADPELHGWLETYATPDGKYPIPEATLNQQSEQLVSDVKGVVGNVIDGVAGLYDGAKNLTGEQVKQGIANGAEATWSFVTGKLEDQSPFGMVGEFASNCASNGIGCVVPNSMMDTHGSAADKAFIDRLTGNTNSYLSNTNGIVYEGVADTANLLLMVTPAGAGRKALGEATDNWSVADPLNPLAGGTSSPLSAPTIWDNVSLRTDMEASAATDLQYFYEQQAMIATRNSDADRVFLGRHTENLDSYEIVADNSNATYFQLDEWDSVRDEIGADKMWFINEKFMDQQWDSGKEIKFSHDPEQPKDLFGGAYYEKEIDYLRSKGIKNFERIEDGYWKAIKEKDENE